VSVRFAIVLNVTIALLLEPRETRRSRAFGRAFDGVDVAVDRLKVRQALKVEQSRPRRVSVFAPDPEQRDATSAFRHNRPPL
jgi:hypothetical protein